jgi:hypothetical protein
MITRFMRVVAIFVLATPVLSSCADAPAVASVPPESPTSCASYGGDALPNVCPIPSAGGSKVTAPPNDGSTTSNGANRGGPRKTSEPGNSGHQSIEPRKSKSPSPPSFVPQSVPVTVGPNGQSFRPDAVGSGVPLPTPNPGPSLPAIAPSPTGSDTPPAPVFTPDPMDHLPSWPPSLPATSAPPTLTPGPTETSIPGNS